MLKPIYQNTPQEIKIEIYILGKEKGVLENKKVKYLTTKCKCYKVIYFRTEGVYVSLPNDHNASQEI